MAAGFARESISQLFALEAADIELTSDQWLEQFLVVIVEEVEAAIGAAVSGKRASTLPAGS